MTVIFPKKLKPSANGALGTSYKQVRIEVKKTYKLYIDGKFSRSESGKTYLLKNKETFKVNVCKASKKDLRDSIVSNRKAQGDWAKRSAYNKAQILYRIAETLESRSQIFIDTLHTENTTEPFAKAQVAEAVDLLVYYAGWCDKYIQVFSSVNPVESSHFNFSFPEACGVATVIAPKEESLLGLVASIAPLIVGGNVCTVIANEENPLSAIEFAEVLNASDVPPGVINILTGQKKDLLIAAANHMDVNAIVYSDLNNEESKTVQLNAALNVKRVIDYTKEKVESPYRIMQCQEIKTTWHPIGI